MIDPISLAISYLRPLFPGVKVQADLVGREPGIPTIEVVLIDIDVKVEHKLYGADLAFYAYHSTKRDAVALAITLQNTLLELMPNKTVTGAYVTAVEDGIGPKDQADETSLEQRYLYTACIYYFEI